MKRYLIMEADIKDVDSGRFLKPSEYHKGYWAKYEPWMDEALEKIERYERFIQEQLPEHMKLIYKGEEVKPVKPNQPTICDLSDETKKLSRIIFNKNNYIANAIITLLDRGPVTYQGQEKLDKIKHFLDEALYADYEKEP